MIRSANANRCLSVIVLAATFVGASVAFTSPADAQRCSRECSWTVVMGKCKTVFGAKVPCPLRKKVCGERICTQSVE